MVRRCHSRPKGFLDYTLRTLMQSYVFWQLQNPKLPSLSLRDYAFVFQRRARYFHNFVEALRFLLPVDAAKVVHFMNQRVIERSRLQA